MKKSKPTTSVPGKAAPKRVEAELERLAGVSKSEGAIRLVQRENDDAPPILFYSTDKGMKLELRVAGGDVWCAQKQMAALFGVSVPSVNEHIQKYLDDGEIDGSVNRKFRITAADGKTYETNHYALDVAFYVGYRVNSRQGALFRRGATDILVRFAKYGYAIDVERLKAPEQPSVIDELKDIIRDIRASTANVYREVRRIVSLCQDYDGSNKDAREFYARMENKLLFVATGKTARLLSSARTRRSGRWGSPIISESAGRRLRTRRSPTTTSPKGRRVRRTARPRCCWTTSRSSWIKGNWL